MSYYNSSADNPLVGNPYAPPGVQRFATDEANAQLALAYETRTAGLLALIPHIQDRAEQLSLLRTVRRRYGLERQ